MEDSPPEGSINAYRNHIYRACIGKAEKSPGYFTATIPTGGGKTRSLVAFALLHAIEHSLSRVVVAVPYTSIIEQNAEVYRGIFGPENVVEHHSLADPTTRRNEKATQNWDAPFIITTTIQLFESLYASSSGQARKLHNLADSVLVLDEVQSLPARVLDPCLRRLDQLVDQGASVVCSTATNPGFQIGESPVELVDEHSKLAEDMKRVKYEPLGTLTAMELGQKITEEHQALVVCNTVDDAETVARAAGARLLTSRQCPCDRSAILEEVKTDLKADRSVHLASTQLIEAGVNIDFPTLYRVIGPAPSIIQAGGRCNREDNLEYGTVYIVDLKDGSKPPGAYKAGTTITANRLDDWDFSDPDVTDRYFDELSKVVSFDQPGVLEAEDNLAWDKASSRMNLIEDAVSVIVPRTEQVERGIEKIREGTITASEWRSLQNVTVGLYGDKGDEARDAGKIEYLDEENEIAVWLDEYDPTIGVQV